MGLGTISAADARALQTFTLAEIDEQLEVLNNLLQYSQKANRKSVLIKIDVWLDRRIMLMEMEGTV